MSVLTALTKIAVIGSVGAVLYSTLLGGIPFGKPPAPVEQGYANPAQVKLYAPVNENGNRELFLTYENGEMKVSLPVLEGPNGPIVGDADYYWSSISSEIQSRLVEESWSELKTGTRKSILKGELEKMIENYGKGEMNDK